jgi:hypothetical protein
MVVKQITWISLLLCLIPVTGCSHTAAFNRAIQKASCGAANTPPPSGPEGAGGGISRTAQGVEACRDK